MKKQYREVIGTCLNELLIIECIEEKTLWYQLPNSLSL